MQRHLKRLLPVWFMWVFAFNAWSQLSMVYQDPEASLRTALELFNKEKYAMAREIFLEVADQYPEASSPIRARAEYLAAVCGFELFNNNADQVLESFLAKQDASTLTPYACLQLGMMEYRKGSFHKAVRYLTRVDKAEISEHYRDEYLFKLGYSYLRTNDLTSADKSLALIRDSNSLYHPPATYFRSHIAYTRGDYQKALKGFKILRDDPTFKSIVPFYMAQIYYLEGEDDKLMEMAPGLLGTANVKRGPEIARMIGETYFKSKQYKDAVSYLQHYVDKTKTSVSRHDYYQLAYASYKTNDYSTAIDYFNRCIGPSDTLSQNAFYHLGDCYIQTGQKKFALNAFHSAYKEGYDFPMKEDALFNYAKLSYELSYNPYNEAVRALKQYIAEYPSSNRLDEANTYLVNLYMSTKNYKEALNSLATIRNKDPRLLPYAQRLNFYRGIEEFNDGQYQDAAPYFSRAAQDNFDKSIQASAVFWEGECAYRSGKYEKAIELLKQFQLTPGSFGLDFYPQADYVIAYSYFKLKDYEKAIVSFRKLFTNRDRTDEKTLNDAYLRTGDCYYVSRNYSEAVDYYGRAARLNRSDRDYALYQTALAYGASGKLREKANALESLISDHPASAMQPQARYELGLTWLALRNDAQAIKSFGDLIEKYPSSRYVKDALLRSGLIHYNQDQNDLALATFQKVVSDYPGTPESKEALMSIRNIYVDMNKVDDFFVYAKNLPFANVTDAAQDSITYLAAENQYMARDCQSASRGFKNYLEKFKTGIFRLNAHFYLAECLYKGNQADEALESYLYVIQQPKSGFSESALLNISAIYFSRQDYGNALNHYTTLKQVAEVPSNLLIAQTGIMRCTFLTKNYPDCLKACEAVIMNEKTSPELMAEAWLTKAKAALNTGDTALAIHSFEQTYKLAKNVMGAEASYHLAEIKHLEGSDKEAEKMIFDFINEFPSYDYWLARSFILLADVYVKLENRLQAKQTLQSIIDNYEGPDLVALAKEKLNQIEAAELQEAKQKALENQKALEKEGEQNTIKIEQEGLIEQK
ncbi:MAG TPA: tetratricopeptide repeat protein [Bacteroidales bacterium]|nr:tetratricopeptide repeat protein [Bacteroidales bacterium]HSA42912.1 tetratricopeptide repeat protein [Bacteroidales bacterium]